MSPPLEFRFEFDEAYVAQANARYRRTNRRSLPRRILRWIATPILLGFGGLLAWMGEWRGPAFLLLMVLTLWIDEIFVTRRFKVGSFASPEVSTALDMSGLRARDALSEVEFGWSACASARVFEDGILLVGRSNELRWLPYAALVSGEAAEVEALVRSKIADCADVR